MAAPRRPHTRKPRTKAQPLGAPTAAELAEESEEAYLLRAIAEITDDVAHLRTLLRTGASVSTAITALRRQLGELREQLSAVRARRGDRLSPADRMERQRHLVRSAPDALLEVSVEEWCRRRRVSIGALASLVVDRA